MFGVVSSSVFITAIILGLVYWYANRSQDKYNRDWHETYTNTLSTITLFGMVLSLGTLIYIVSLLG